MADLNDLIKDAQEKGLMSIAPLKFRGKAKPVFEMLAIMADTEPIEADKDWWGVRAYILAHDMARERIPLYDTRIATIRRN